MRQIIAPLVLLTCVRCHVKSFRRLHDAASVMFGGSSLLNIDKTLKDGRPK